MRKKYPKRLPLCAKIHTIMDRAMDRSSSYMEFKINVTIDMRNFIQDNYRRRQK